MIPGLERSPGEGIGNPLQYSCLGKSHGQRRLAGYSVHQRVRHDLVTKEQHNPDFGDQSSDYGAEGLEKNSRKDQSIGLLPTEN